MKRGELWTMSASGYAGKPRPAVILQSDDFSTSDSLTVCPLTTDETEAPLFRLMIHPSEESGLHLVSRIMVDKIVTIPREKLGKRIGQLADEDVVRLNRAILTFLGLA